VFKKKKKFEGRKNAKYRGAVEKKKDNSRKGKAILQKSEKIDITQHQGDEGEEDVETGEGGREQSGDRGE